MPLYEYACASCGHQFEARHKISDDPIKICPSCHKETVERLVSRTSFALKGSGWYADGYGAPGSGTKSETKTTSEPKTEAAKSEAKPASDASTTASPKTESTPEPAKTESKPKKDTGD